MQLKHMRRTRLKTAFWPGSPESKQGVPLWFSDGGTSRGGTSPRARERTRGAFRSS